MLFISLIWKMYLNSLTALFVLLHNSSTKLSESFSIDDIYVAKLNIGCYQILNNWNNVDVESLELIGPQSILYIDEYIQKFWIFFLQLFTSV